MFKYMTKILLILSTLFLSHTSYAWEGYNYDTGSYIDIESYDHNGNGEGEVEYYDYSTGEYSWGYLDMYPGGSGTLYDYNTGEYYDVDMD